MPSIVDRLSLWSGAAGPIPLPLVDMAAVGGVQLYMLRRLSEIYEIPFSENLGKSILSSLAGAVIPATTATTAASVMKGRAHSRNGDWRADASSIRRATRSYPLPFSMHSRLSKGQFSKLLRVERFSISIHRTTVSS